jgi:DUF4097 and DUF4098 domain-containing protein YvlB
MKMYSLMMHFLRVAIAITLTVICVSLLFGQEKAEKAEKAQKANKAEYKTKHKEFCSGDNWSNGDKVSFRELREMTIPATGSLAVDGGKNGGIRVSGTNPSEIVVRACVQTWGTSEEAAKAIAANIKINTSGTVKAENADESNASVSYDIRVPRSTDLRLNAHNGGISIGSVEGTLEFETMNGGLHLSDIAGSVRGRTTNGGVHVQLSGSSWKGSGLDLMTTNGGVHLSIPESFAAHFETGTVNGGFHSNIAAMSVPEDKDKEHWGNRKKNISVDLNGGGAPVRLITTNGGVHINSSEKSAKY